MNTLSHLYNWFLDSLFPRPSSEEILISMSPENAWKSLPRAPVPPLANSSSIFAYKDERVTKLVWNIKYKKLDSAVKIGGYALFHDLLAHANSPAKTNSGSFNINKMLILPMPITVRRRHERGYNQCELLTDEIARLDTNHLFTIEQNLLTRIHHDSRQTLKNREQRLVSAKGIFAVNEKTLEKFSSLHRSTNNKDNLSLKNCAVIIIDDVITTGSTMKEAMETMRKAGFTNVRGLSLAH